MEGPARALECLEKSKETHCLKQKSRQMGGKVGKGHHKHLGVNSAAGSHCTVLGRKVTRSEFYVKRITLAAMLGLHRDGKRVESGGPLQEPRQEVMRISCPTMQALPRGGPRTSLPGDHIFTQLCFSPTAEAPTAGAVRKTGPQGINGHFPAR